MFGLWARFAAKTAAAMGSYRHTVTAARDAGLALYNEAILLNSVGSAALRAQRIVRTRKLTRVHQHVLVFREGQLAEGGGGVRVGGNGNVSGPTCK